MWAGFDSQTWRHMWVEFVGGSRPCSERFLSGELLFSPLLRKTTFPNSNSIQNLRATGFSVINDYWLSPSLNNAGLFILIKKKKRHNTVPFKAAMVGTGNVKSLKNKEGSPLRVSMASSGEDLPMNSRSRPFEKNFPLPVVIKN